MLIFIRIYQTLYNFSKRRLRQISLFFGIIFKRIRNRLPDWFVEFFHDKALPFASMAIILVFTLIANVAQARENNNTYDTSQDVLDLSPADIAGVVSEVDTYTPLVVEDPLSVAIAMKDENFLEKPQITDTKITQEPKAPEKRKNTINYIVEDGDTLAKIAWKYSLKISTVKSTNNLTSDIIRPGQTLRIPTQDISPTQIASLSKKKTSGITIPFSGTFRRPTSGWAISQVYGHTSYERNHTGVDLDSRSGTSIFASASGRVSLFRGWGGGYGNHIVIDHGGGFSTLYGHLSSFSVSAGQLVNQGQRIGTMGSTGWSTGTHLHFEIRFKGASQNPFKYL